MATTTYGTPYVAGTDLVANWPAASLTVANSIDAAGYYVGRGINAQTASYTTVLTDAGKTVSMTNAGATTLTIPANASVAYVVGTRINILNLGAGACTPTAGAGVTIAGTITALATNKAASVVKTATNTWSYIPFSSGADAAVITSTTGSPTITTDGTATIYTYTGSGTIVVGTAGAATVLVISGGGGSGYTGSVIGGGGAGGLIEKTMTLTAATHTITIGPGGASGATVGTAGTNSSLGTLVLTGGGGPGVGATSTTDFYPTFANGGGYSGGLIHFSSAAGREGMGAGVGAGASVGYTSSISGSSVEYGTGGKTPVSTNKGSGGYSTSNGVTGVVIIRVG
jgi:hypothetical protein